MNLYILTFDPHKTDAASLHAVISGMSVINGWWHYLGSTYILASSSDLQSVTNYILQYWPNQRFFLAKAPLTSGSYNGWLPKDAWDWIKKNRGTL